MPQADSAPSEQHRPRWLRWVGRQMVPNVGTLLLVVVLLLTVPSLAAPLYAPAATSTSTISYQGRLADSSGNPLTGKYNLEFRIYTVPTGGTPLWTEMWTGGNAVDVSDGLFNVMLGSINNTLASAIQGRIELYLGITVGTDSEMSPRVQLGSVPFAMVAGQLAAHGPGLIQTWNHGAMEAFDSTGTPATRVTFNTGIDVEVPSGTTQYYLVVYRGTFGLDWSERTGTNDSFYGQWFARLVDGATVLGDCRIVQTGFRSRWDAVGGTTYWRSPFWTSWIVQLGGGIHSLDIAIYGYSDATMNYGHLEGQSLQVLPLY